MKATTREILSQLSVRYPALAGVETDVLAAFMLLKECFLRGGRVYLCGNGGSACDCEHIAGELLKSFKKCRPLDNELVERLSKDEDGEAILGGLDGGLPVVSLCGFSGFSTAYGNDKNPAFTFAQLVNVLGKEGDVLLTLSTSGNSKNCVYAVKVAKARGMESVLLSGGDGGVLKAICDVSVVVPEKETYKVQEYHLPVYHCLCAMLEEEFF